MPAKPDVEKSLKRIEETLKKMGKNKEVGQGSLKAVLNWLENGLSESNLNLLTAEQLGRLGRCLDSYVAGTNHFFSELANQLLDLVRSESVAISARADAKEQYSMVSLIEMTRGLFEAIGVSYYPGSDLFELDAIEEKYNKISERHPVKALPFIQALTGDTFKFNAVMDDKKGISLICEFSSKDKESVTLPLREALEKNGIAFRFTNVKIDDKLVPQIKISPEAANAFYYYQKGADIAMAAMFYPEQAGLAREYLEKASELGNRNAKVALALNYVSYEPMYPTAAKKLLLDARKHHYGNERELDHILNRISQRQPSEIDSKKSIIQGNKSQFFQEKVQESGNIPRALPTPKKKN